ncbi:proline-rich transmembrane protein 1 [Magallana gigas]|uniref:proline-rich transmembrane protein 1 n=1 Tax=Magallana gigas TaxID=29159 RepID=UPI0033414943
MSSSKGLGEPPSYNEATNCDQLKLTYENQNNHYPGDNQYPSPSGGPYPVNQHQPQCPPQHQVMLPLVTQPGAMVINRAPVAQNWMVPAVLTCLCCFWPTGICAILAASNANQAAANGDVIEAEKQSRKARSYVTVSLVIGTILIMLGVVYRVALYSTMY